MRNEKVKLIITKQFYRLNFKSIVNIQRNPNFKILSQNDLNYFSTILPIEDILTSDLEHYNTDWMRKFKGDSKVVLRPKTTEQVSKILKYCNDEVLAVVPQSGNTGLVGGSVPVFDEIILSLAKMNKIINFDVLSGTLHCEAGCILESLNNFLDPHGYTMPLDLGAKGSCLIGGNLSTNAGGIHFVKYGSIRNNCKGLKAVTADGSIIECMVSLPKNNTGYDLKQLFIGSEGTLGIITECLINTPTKQKYTDLAIVSCSSFEELLVFYKKAKENMGASLSAIEFFDGEAMNLQEKHSRHSPLESKHPFYLMVERASDNPNNSILLEEFLTILNPTDGVIAQDENQKKKIWEIRETMSEVASKRGLVLSYDISLPLTHYYKAVEETRKRVGDLAKVIGYGHIGDCNLHLNVCYNKFEKDEKFKELQNIMEPFIYDFVQSCNGSISAEHGIGIFKAKYLNKSQSQECINVMKLVKKSLDPNGILNPYKIIV